MIALFAHVDFIIYFYFAFQSTFMMNNYSGKTVMKNNRYIILFGVVGALLLIPAMGMLISTEVNWSLFDFIVMGLLLTGLVFAVDFAYRKLRNSTTGVAVLIAIMLLFFTIWAELAIGIFGTPFAGN